MTSRDTSIVAPTLAFAVVACRLLLWEDGGDDRGRPAAPGRRWTAMLAWAVAGLAVLALVPGLRLVLLANTAGLPDAQGTIATIIAAYAAVVLATVSSAAVGALLASRRPRHPVGWLLFGVGLAVPLSLLVEWYTKYGLLGRPGSLPAAEHLVGFAVLGFTVIWLACAGFVLLLTPTGRLPSPRWRWWARVTAAAPVVVVLASVVQPDPLAPDANYGLAFRKARSW
jgi:hypothetical protein